MCNLVVANRTTASPGRRIKRGTVLCADDPAVRRTSGVFEPYRVHHYCDTEKKAPVETMTSGPGELRDLSPYHCDHPGCSATAKSPAGLAAHKRSHNGDSD